VIGEALAPPVAWKQPYFWVNRIFPFAASAASAAPCQGEAGGKRRQPDAIRTTHELHSLTRLGEVLRRAGWPFFTTSTAR